MTDWAKLTVAKLKDACAERDVSTTGLKLKQQFVDKLTEWEIEQNAPAMTTEHVETEELKEDTNNPPELDVDEKAQPNDVKDQDQEAHSIDKTHDGLVEENNATQTEIGNETSDAVKAAANPANDEQLAAPVAEIVTADEAETVTEEIDAVQVTAPERDIETGIVNTPPEPQVLPQTSQEPSPPSEHVPVPLQPAPTDDRTRSSSVPLAEAQEDSRKRKRRSVTPPPKEEEIALKKAKANNGSPLLRAAGARAEQQAAIDGAGVDADAGPVALGLGLPAAKDSVESEPVRLASPLPVHQRSPSPKDDRLVDPSVHPATPALYIRNFKRPLRAPDLQAHIASLARSSKDQPDSNPIRFFYLDVIRTHAYVRFDSVTAASRVRSYLHNTRWPDEPTRDLLWVDFIPDDKAEAWANQEADSSAGSGFGGRSGAQKRWEIVYDSTADGVKASLQDASAVRRQSHQQQTQQRPSTGPNRKPSVAIEPATGLHPDRAALLPRDRDYPDRRNNSSTQDRHPSQRRPAQTERGFAALDELFSSTRTTKPKLYYKPVSSEIAEERLDMIKRLRVGHEGMGKSGDEGMIRYTFETDRGRAEWVDKGPEFGFGRKGRERLVGDGPARPRGGRGGGYRGGGRGRVGGNGMASPGRVSGGGGVGGTTQKYTDWDAPPRRGGDSWRGSAR